MDLFGEIYTKSRSTQAYRVDAFWVIIFFIYARCHNVRNTQYKDVYRRTIEFPQCTRIFKGNCYLKFHNVPLKSASPISE